MTDHARWTRIRLMVATAVAAAVLGAVWLVPGAGTGGAAVVAGISEDDCTALMELGDETPDVTGSSSGFEPKELKAAATGFARTAKKIEDKKLKKAMKNLASIYGRMATSKNAPAALAIALGSGKKYGKALATFGTASLECVTSQITIPTLPSNVTLPPGITLPPGLTIPGR